ncbi:hypothetical protein TNCV_257051 [Trichonephila clavipes]|nr:hypothetical protein TNCV_257051 [Trichonephila clavipes]
MLAMHPNSMSEMQQQDIVTGIARSCGHVGRSTADTDLTACHTTSDFRWSQKKKFKGLRPRECGGQEADQLRPIHLPGYVVGNAPESKNVLVLNYARTTRSGAQRPVLSAATLGEVRNLHTCPTAAISLHSFIHSPRLAILLQTATIIAIFTDEPWFVTPCSMIICRPHAASSHLSEFVGLIRQHSCMKINAIRYPTRFEDKFFKN